MKRFRNRADAGRVLAACARASARARRRRRPRPARGGVPVAHEVATALDAPLEVFLARKLGVPGQPELAMGAIAAGGVRVLHQAVVDSLRITPQAIEEVAAREGAELARREQAYRTGRPPLDLGGRTVVVVDDGLATGATMRAAVTALRAQGPRRIVVAVPVGARETCEELSREADEVVCAHMPPRVRSGRAVVRRFRTDHRRGDPGPAVRRRGGPAWRMRSGAWWRRPRAGR